MKEVNVEDFYQAVTYFQCFVDWFQFRIVGPYHLNGKVKAVSLVKVLFQLAVGLRFE